MDQKAWDKKGGGSAGGRPEGKFRVQMEMPRVATLWTRGGRMQHMTGRRVEQLMAMRCVSLGEEPGGEDRHMWNRPGGKRDRKTEAKVGLRG